MNEKRILVTFVGILILLFSCTDLQKNRNDRIYKNQIRFENLTEKKSINIYVDGKLFTSYVYSDTLKKPILFPIISPNGKPITRGFPLEPKVGESTDHPHQTGFWFNYGNVNGINYWGNGSWIPDSLADRYGTIYLKSIDTISNKTNKGKLTVTHEWIDSQGKVLLEEHVNFTFYAELNYRIIDRETKLIGIMPEILFPDTKEGAFAIRVATFLELPTSEARAFLYTEENSTTDQVDAIQSVNGNYISSEGIKGVNVWGTRAKWMKLYGVIGLDTISVVFMDHPSNLNYPTYWHARDYGLFSANPFGVKDFTVGKEQLNFKMKIGESVTFKHRLYIKSGNNFSLEDIEKKWEEFIKN